MLSINNLKVGTIFKYDQDPYQVLEAQHVKMGRGGAILRTKIKNLISGEILEKNFKAANKFEEVTLTRSKANYLYKEGDNYHFMDTITFDQFFFSKEKLGDKINFLKESQEVSVLNFDGEPVDIELPKKIDLKIKEAPPGVKGDTAQGSVTKPVILETGLVIQTPLFIKNGDIIKVNTETGEYVGRVS